MAHWTAAPAAVQPGATSTLKRYNQFASTRQQKTCPNCREGAVVIQDHHSGDELCARCGLVLEARMLSEEQEWRSFSNSDGGGADKSRVGGPNDTWLEQGVQSTSMIGGDKKHQRLMHTHEMTTAIGASDKQLRTAFSNLRSMADFLNVPEVVTERCKEIVKELQNSDTLRGRTGDVYMLATIYCACRETNSPHSIKELVKFNRAITEKQLGRAINRLKKLLPQRAPVVNSTTAADLVLRISPKLQLSKELADVAEHVCRQAEKYINRSHRPCSVTGGALYLVAQICNLHLDAAEIASLAKAGVSTVIQVYKEMLPLSQQLLPPGFQPPRTNT